MVFVPHHLAYFICTPLNVSLHFSELGGGVYVKQLLFKTSIKTLREWLLPVQI